MDQFLSVRVCDAVADLFVEFFNVCVCVCGSVGEVVRSVYHSITNHFVVSLRLGVMFDMWPWEMWCFAEELRIWRNWAASRS